MKKEEQLSNIDREIEILKNCILDLEYQKQFVVDVDDYIIDELNKGKDIDEKYNGKFLFFNITNNRCDCIFTCNCHLYTRSIDLSKLNNIKK
jgi:hypothetical protein